MLSRATSVKFNDEADRFGYFNRLALGVVVLGVRMRSLKDSLASEVDALARQRLQAVKQVCCAPGRGACCTLVLALVIYPKRLLQQRDDVDKARQQLVADQRSRGWLTEDAHRETLH